MTNAIKTNATAEKRQCHHVYSETKVSSFFLTWGPLGWPERFSTCLFHQARAEM